MSSITANPNVRSGRVYSSEEPNRADPEGVVGGAKGTVAQFWAAVMTWDSRIKAMVGIASLLVGSVTFLVTWVLPVMVERAVGPRFDALEQQVDEIRQDVDEIKEDVAALQEDMAEVREDVAALQKDMAEVREDVAALQEDVAELQEDVAELHGNMAEVRQGQAYIKGQMDLLVQFAAPGPPGAPEPE